MRRCVWFMSRETFESKIPPRQCVFISINTPDNPLAKPKGSRWCGGLFWVRADDSMPVPENEVRMITQFVDTWREHDFIVHCDAGMSRSAAVAQYIGAVLDREVIGLDSDGQFSNSVIKAALMRTLWVS